VNVVSDSKEQRRQSGNANGARAELDSQQKEGAQG
jgi:hypothetical protein